MRKQILTDKDIEKDIVAYRSYRETYTATAKLSAARHLLRLLVISVAIIVAAFKFIHWALGIACLALPIILVIVFIPIIRAENKSKSTVTSDEFTVIKETLVNVGKETVVDKKRTSYIGRRRQRYAHLNEADFLYFSSRKWRVPPKCYTWSEEFRMSRDGIVNTAVIGNEFYLVICNKTQEILVAYNTKIFEY